jgi:hypothetical protein
MHKCDAQEQQIMHSSNAQIIAHALVQLNCDFVHQWARSISKKKDRKKIINSKSISEQQCSSDFCALILFSTIHSLTHRHTIVTALYNWRAQAQIFFSF